MGQQLQTAVVGATGYAGFELARLLGKHPRLAKPLLFTREAGSSSDLTEYYPHVLGNGQLRVYPFDWQKLADSGVDVLFLATPHEISREWAPEALKRGIRVIDLSGAWRLKREAHRAIYGFHDANPVIANQVSSAAVYGLPELRSNQISGSKLVANPGCYATSIIVALAPLVTAKVINRSAGIICDSKSGVSGAGKQPTATTHFVEVADNLSAYGIFTHRHLGEILEQLDLERVYPRYGFPNDMLVHLNVWNARVRDVPARPVYGVGERSGIKLRSVVPRISWLLVKGFFWRMREKYVIRDFHPLVLFYLLGFVMTVCGLGLGIAEVVLRIMGNAVSVGTVVLVALLLIFGSQFTLFAMWFDMESNKDLR
jgi:hypothetical protein